MRQMRREHTFKYRADIDGLRALAVLPVVAYHAGFTTLAPGGFVGVDVFFVISGYLITGIIQRDIEAGKYSVRAFYVRRIRRIFPALFAMYLAVFIASLALLFGSEIASVGRSIIFSILFMSNVLFYTTSSYFSGALEHNPLLHTWSLSVEEQFYVVFPFVALALRKLNAPSRFWVFAGLTGLGLLIAAAEVVASPTAAFYLVQYRAWELLLGAMFAVWPFSYLSKGILSETFGLCGVALIAGSVRFLNSTSLFPGLTAVPACLGAALIIFSGSDTNTITSRALSLPPIRSVGIVSYSLYLWHWPIFVLARLFWPFEATIEKIGLVGVALIAAVLSWRWIESPLRNAAPNISLNRTIWIGISAMLVGCMIAGAATLTRRGANEAERLLAYEQLQTPSYMRIGTCFLTSQYTQFSMYDQRECLAIKPRMRNLLILGDSHAADLHYGLSKTYPNINFLQATASGCKPVLNPTGEKRCVDLVTYILNDFISAHRIDGVILSARWTTSDVSAAKRTAAALARRVGTVIVIGPVPEYEQSLPRLLATAVANGVDAGTQARRFGRLMPIATERAFRSEKFARGVFYYSAIEAMAKNCQYIAGKQPVQFDYGHLSEAGSKCVAQAMKPFLDDQPVSQTLESTP
jgi:peptidoglycan/LPS O-acetylase OafA/YrhL